MTLFHHLPSHELAGAISRQTQHIDQLTRRRRQLAATFTEPWSYQAANRMTELMTAKLDREIRAEKRVLRDMWKAYQGATV